MFQYIILYCLNNLNGERSVANIYYLLKGKKSTQTIQDSYLYNLTEFFGVYRSIARSNFNRVIDELAELNYISISGKAFATVNHEGQQNLAQLDSEFQNTYFKGMTYEKHAPQFLATFILLIQTVTNLHIKKSRFIPVIDNGSIQTNVKNFLQNKPLDMSVLLRDIYDDLRQIFSTASFPDFSIDIFVDYLTSANEIGLSQQQIALKYNISKEDVHFHLFNIIHYILEQMKLAPAKYKVLPYMSNQRQDLSLTDSAMVTYNYYGKGYSIKEIAGTRDLKESTVQDHIVEIAYVGEVKWSDHMSDEEYSMIKKALVQTNTKQLKTLKELLPDFITYFQIKLVIALWHKND
ncbi:helix-turn-helix domain-containing protein [Gracilibacillus oryzae]|nr:helix-turn-helix domain-containing protein [Gracilibacillus oryzae]